VSPRERIQIDAELISEAEWTAAYESVHAAAEALLAEELIEAHPSFFETITAMAFLAFAMAKVDIVVLETGLGGRLDGTNIIVPEVAVITQIDFDHEAFLGSSIELIAAEKAGIIKADRPVVFSEQRPEAFAVLEKKALELNAPVTLSSAWRVESLELHRYGSRFTLASDTEIAIECPLAGLHQVENARTAVAALTVFGLAPVAIAEGIRRAVWLGRLQRVSSSPDVILDGAHNPAGAKALASYIKQFFAHEPIRIVYGAMRDKAVDEVTNVLFPLAAEVIVTAPDQPRALNPGTLAEAVEHPNLRVAATFQDALAMMNGDPMTTFITGSLFLVGEASSALAERS
jgi:dihydrofolate synthase/folylpolyglutamate synthase